MSTDGYSGLGCAQLPRTAAVVRIGELSAGLDASKGGANPSATRPTGGKSKSEVLREAGISTSAAPPRAARRTRARPHLAQARVLRGSIATGDCARAWLGRVKTAVLLR